ncbi:septum formation inhibitor Maf [Vibrio metschnikovii]|uniref:7-methyl-GTP pyrophosphatase n=3 Tax=Unclassified Bacteria TaxID=49928 RepID=A0AAU6SZR6_UNCXX|nr:MULTISPECIES: nucleoside triphosphate pyrophosphatase [Vibrio]EKO3557760.1 septum formation inhibitor Maf [Vibrio metschnikovii]EKO3564289.1 septum formation inhibitor Maf [Vibrio metschnikovii]EKO3569726.1 septum formation inhibitor Maf [Vibrio metschnikovii]EKO3572884.1 septum formation inhibitor Maf [Vibrio metschnikovii]EKO3573985.1 septum formation inhibitor Maf [Vibrio metschnikovii]
MQNYQLVLASTSPYRQQLLEKLAIPFVTASPDCDETPLTDETPEQLVMRLATNKARSCQLSSPSLVIGSDQVCVINGQIIGKPYNRETAIHQLLQQSGQTITFYTGLALHNTQTEQTQVTIDTFKVHFRTLTPDMVARYVDKEQPFYCAGSFKSEGLGIALFERLEGDDPNSLIGLPLIKLIKLLESEQIRVI